MIWSSLIAQGKRRLLMSVLLAVLLSLVYLYLARFYQERVDSWLLGVGWALILLNLLRAGLGALYRWDRQPFERFDLGLEDDRVRPGEAFRLENRAPSATILEPDARRGPASLRRSKSHDTGPCRETLARGDQRRIGGVVGLTRREPAFRNRASRTFGRADNVQGFSGADSLDHFSRRRGRRLRSSSRRVRSGGGAGIGHH